MFISKERLQAACVELKIVVGKPMVRQAHLERTLGSCWGKIQLDEYFCALHC